MALRNLLGPAPDPRRVRHDLHLSRERMGRLLDVSAKTVERWEERGDIPSRGRVRSQMAQLQEVVELGANVFTPDGFRQFLTTPLPAFRGRTALQMIEQGEADKVIATLASTYEGLGY